MTSITLHTLTDDRHQEPGEVTSHMQCGRMIKDAIADMVQKRYEMTEEEKREMNQKVELKLKMGKKLTSEEMEYLRMYQPDLYKRVVRIEMKRKMLRTQLKHAKSKDEVHMIVSGSLSMAEKDVDKEYMTAMISREAGEFMKSSAYARLPQTAQEGQKKRKTSDAERYFARKDRLDEEQETTHRFSVFTQLRVQCIQIGELVAASGISDS